MKIELAGHFFPSRTLPALLALAVVLPASGQTQTVTYETQYTYDLQGRLISASYAGETMESMAIVYAYDPAGNIVSVQVGGPELVASDHANEIPKVFALGASYPNPFNPTTTIPYALPRAARVQVEVFDVLGRRIATLFDGVAEPGSYTVEWDGRATNGAPVSSGVYFYRMRAADFVASRSTILMK